VQVEAVWTSPNIVETKVELESERALVESVWEAPDTVEPEPGIKNELVETKALRTEAGVEPEPEIESKSKVGSESVWTSANLAEARTEYESAQVDAALAFVWEQASTAEPENHLQSNQNQEIAPMFVLDSPSALEPESKIESESIVEEVIPEPTPQYTSGIARTIEIETPPISVPQVSSVVEAAEEQTAPRPKRGTRVLDETWEPEPRVLGSQVSSIAEVTKEQPAPRPKRATRVLDETWEPPGLVPIETGPTYRPGQIFLSRITSSWASLTVTTLVVMVICGAAAFAVVKWREGSLVLTSPTRPSEPRVTRETDKAIKPAETTSVKKAETIVTNRFELLSSSASGEVLKEEEAKAAEPPATVVNRTRTSPEHVTKPPVRSSTKRAESESNPEPVTRAASSVKKETKKVDEPAQTPAAGNGVVRARTVTPRKGQGESISSGIVSPKPKTKVIQWP
jgi:hypothetical protein